MPANRMREWLNEPDGQTNPWQPFVPPAPTWDAGGSPGRGGAGGSSGRSDLEAEAKAQQDKRDAIVKMYQDLLGRTPSEAEVDSHMGNPGGLPAVGLLIRGTNEYKEYQNRITAEKAAEERARRGGTGGPPLNPGWNPTETNDQPSPGPDGTITAPNGDWRSWFPSFMGGVPATPGNLLAREADLLKYGVKVLRNAAGVAGKIQLPDGTVVDVIQGAASGGGGSWQWNTGEGGGSAAGEATTVNPEYLAPWTQAFTPPSDGAIPTGAAPSFQNPGEFGGFSAFQGPGEFKAPTGDSILQDPSYQWRLNQGTGAIENSAAARGVLNSGGTLSDILNYGQGAASQEYQNVWNRDYAKWNTDYGNAFNKWKAENDNSLSTYGLKYGQATDAYNRATDLYGMAKNNATDSYNRAWTQFLDTKNTWYQNQDKPWSKLYQAASLGANASA